MAVHVTTVERTLVDALHRPVLAGGWEEIWRSFGSAEFLDVDRLIDYAVLLGSALTASKLGLFLEQHQNAFFVKEAQLNRLANYRPEAYRYMDKKHLGPVRSLKRWHLIVPMYIITQSWEEFNDTCF